jgi:predicted PurR-regulated permease PerM
VVLAPWAVLCLFWGDYKKALFLVILAMALFLFRKLAEPKIVGNQTGLSPLASLISIYVGMKLGGVLGMILCPIICMILVGLYGMGFFDPTISDFKQLLHWVLHAAQLDAEDSQGT